ncbi:MAG TPA: potassium channel family protein [Pyrinomonadaceae bacterium]|nr:potassium channel family protein [Pyrinomonadaceae bacterium]
MRIFENLSRHIRSNSLSYGAGYTVISFLFSFYWYLVPRNPADINLEVLPVLYCFPQMCLFGYFGLIGITENGKTLSPNSFLKKIGLLIIFVLTNFAINFLWIYKINPNSFNGITAGNYSEQFVDFFYFSITTFVTVGYGDIVPRIIAAKILVIFEISMNIIILVFVFANYGNVSREMENNK